MINQIITCIKSGEIEKAHELWNTLVLQLRDEVDTAIIACTDLNVVASEDFVDSAQCLAKAVVKMYVEKYKCIPMNISCWLLFSERLCCCSKFINSLLVANLSI